MTATIDYVDDMVQLLLATPAITALTGQRILGEVLPREEYRKTWSQPKNVQPAIIVREAPDSKLEHDGPMARATFEISCYGNSPESARVLSAVVRTALNDKYDLATPAGRTFQYIEQVTSGNGGADEDKWEFFANRYAASFFAD